MDPVVEDLATQHEDLRGVLESLSDAQWHLPTRCEGWDVADVVTHLAQTDELAIASAEGRFGEALLELIGGVESQPSSVDEAVALMVARESGAPTDSLRERWVTTSRRLTEVLDAMDLSARVQWVTGEISARSLATTRLAETWIHEGDVTSALGIVSRPNEGLRQIARLAWRTLPYAFESAGRTMTGPVAFSLTSPSGDVWEFRPDAQALTTVSGPAAELCEVAGRRVPARETTLVAEGPDAETVLDVIRTYA
jgi:uncharacterized protein (TIGR03084 family)